METIAYRAIGVVHSPFKELKGTPIQPTVGQGTAGTVEIFPKYAQGLKDLDGFSHIYVLYHFHLARGNALVVKPFLDDVERGIFATRAASRPNAIGLSVVRLARVEGNILHIEDLDIVDGTPVLDLKPYVPEFDARQPERSGWLTTRLQRLPGTRDDGRFAGPPD
ncbi:MAG: tRNA (N6-threonylcarbamoyladenosine(37)-N6)-methyltransferase TrmO [Chloroflexi bacterium]|nr:MAG: tRNA (N6-threonylcarbamoyladenosine(37)-N6)-methyltransferase TrmO [Chloroflexota bacterium]